MNINPAEYNNECYIVGGGRSLLNFDWTLLNDKFVIAVNMAHIKLPEANIIYVTDPPWIEPNSETLKNHKAPVWQGVLNLNKPPKLPCVDKQWHLTGPSGLETKPNSLKHGSNSLYAAVNLAAVHLKFKKIFLLGADMKWGTVSDQKTSHWHSQTNPHARNDGEAVYVRMRTQFKTIKQPLINMGVQVINVNTPEQTNLEYFPIKSVEEVFG